MEDWRDNILENESDIRALVSNSHRIAVLGIKPEALASKPAHSVPRYLMDHGYEIVPVPTYYPDVTHILGKQVYRTLSEIPGPVDIVDVFRRPTDIPGHLQDMIDKRPAAVWFQLGIRNDDAARELAQAGIKVVQDRCLKIEHGRLSST